MSETETKSGIYKIVNKINGKVYVGSSINLDGRKTEHFNCLKGNRHRNDYLQKSFNKYGEENFSFEIIEFVEPIKEKLLEREQFYLDQYYDNKKNCYNISPTASSRLGSKSTEKAKRRMSEARIGKWSGIDNPFYNKHHTEECKQRLSFLRKGKQRGGDNPHAKVVICVETNELFSNLTAAAKKANISNKNISAVCKGKRNTAGGYHWKYADIT